MNTIRTPLSPLSKNLRYRKGENSIISSHPGTIETKAKKQKRFIKEELKPVVLKDNSLTSWATVSAQIILSVILTFLAMTIFIHCFLPNTAPIQTRERKRIIKKRPDIPTTIEINTTETMTAETIPETTTTPKSKPEFDISYFYPMDMFQRTERHPRKIPPETEKQYWFEYRRRNSPKNISNLCTSPYQYYCTNVDNSVKYYNFKNFKFETLWERKYQAMLLMRNFREDETSKKIYSIVDICSDEFRIKPQEMIDYYYRFKNIKGIDITGILTTNWYIDEWKKYGNYIGRFKFKFVGKKNQMKFFLEVRTKPGYERYLKHKDKIPIEQFQYFHDQEMLKWTSKKKSIKKTFSKLPAKDSDFYFVLKKTIADRLGYAIRIENIRISGYNVDHDLFEEFGEKYETDHTTLRGVLALDALYDFLDEYDARFLCENDIHKAVVNKHSLTFSGRSNLNASIFARGMQSSFETAILRSSLKQNEKKNLQKLVKGLEFSFFSNHLDDAQLLYNALNDNEDNFDKYLALLSIRREIENKNLLKPNGFLRFKGQFYNFENKLFDINVLNVIYSKFWDYDWPIFLKNGAFFPEIMASFVRDCLLLDLRPYQYSKPIVVETKRLEFLVEIIVLEMAEDITKSSFVNGEFYEAYAFRLCSHFDSREKEFNEIILSSKSFKNYAKCKN